VSEGNYSSGRMESPKGSFTTENTVDAWEKIMESAHAGLSAKIAAHWEQVVYKQNSDAKIRDSQRQHYEVKLSKEDQSKLPLASLIKSTVGFYINGGTKRLFQIQGHSGLYLRMTATDWFDNEIVAMNTDPKGSFPSKFRPLTEHELETWMTKVAYKKSLEKEK
jgi:hypothetical protein